MMILFVIDSYLEFGCNDLIYQKILADLNDTIINFRVVLFFAFLVWFGIAEVNYWDKPCTAIFLSRFTATS